jgi:hypothetical protein
MTAPAHLHAVAVTACGVALAGCSLEWPGGAGIDVFAPLSSVTVTVESNPPGAEARTSTGAICRTPCDMDIPITPEFTVTYSLDGYLPQTISVREIQPPRSALVDRTPPRVEPNPVLATLMPAPPPEPPPPVTTRRQRSPPR